MSTEADDIVNDLRETYLKSPCRQTVEELAEKYGKSVRSVVASLSRMGVYKKEPYRSKTGEIPHTKEDIVEVIADTMGCTADELDGLEKAPKLVLRRIALALDADSLDKFKG